MQITMKKDFRVGFGPKRKIGQLVFSSPGTRQDIGTQVGSQHFIQLSAKLLHSNYYWLMRRDTILVEHGLHNANQQQQLGNSSLLQYGSRRGGMEIFPRAGKMFLIGERQNLAGRSQ
jgi:hypothetical protein